MNFFFSKPTCNPKLAIGIHQGRSRSLMKSGCLVQLVNHFCISLEWTNEYLLYELAYGVAKIRSWLVSACSNGIEAFFSLLKAISICIGLANVGC